VELSVLGASSRYLVPLGAGTSYLVRDGDTRLLLDAGNGTHRRLADELRGEALSGVLVSHFHVETVADLLPVALALPPGSPVFAPKRASSRLAGILRRQSADASWTAGARVVGVGRGDTQRVGPLRLTFTKLGHGCPGVATRIEGLDGATLVHLADTGPRDWLADFARGADLLVAHTLLLDRDEGPAKRTNLTAGAAGRLAREAGVRALAISHVPFYRNAEDSLAEAKAAFGGDVLLLAEGQRVAIVKPG
jgi:ribonuclease BN (tRNA processing enzyme)